MADRITPQDKATEPVPSTPRRFGGLGPISRIGRISGLGRIKLGRLRKLGRLHLFDEEDIDAFFG